MVRTTGIAVTVQPRPDMPTGKANRQAAKVRFCNTGKAMPLFCHPMQMEPMHPMPSGAPQAPEAETNQARSPSLLTAWAPIAAKTPSAYPFRIQCDKRDRDRPGAKEFSGFKTAADAIAWFKNALRADPFHPHTFYEVIKVRITGRGCQSRIFSGTGC